MENFVYMFLRVVKFAQIEFTLNGQKFLIANRSASKLLTS